MPQDSALQNLADARAMAALLLEDILGNGQLLEEAWEKTSELKALDARDRGFCRLLILTILRRLHFIDARLAVYLEAPTKLPANARMALRLGAAQLLFLKTSAHAAVSTSVELLSEKDKSLRGLVNAVLRCFAEKETGPANLHSIASQCIPPWMMESWSKNYGAETAARIAIASLTEPPLDITVKSDAALWREKLSAQILPNGSLRLPHQEDIRALPGFAEGEWWVQDAAAALPAMLAGDVRGKSVLDLCAAPGGKTAQLAAAGAKVISVDSSAKRLERLKENLQRLKLEAKIVNKDVLQFRPKSHADIVLLDAPCSATGTLRRHPDLMHQKTQKDVARMAGQQARLLKHAADMVRDGGLLIYAVCSLQAGEACERIDAFLREDARFQRKNLNGTEIFGKTEWVTKAGDLHTLPFHLEAQGGMDGFYAARLIRKR